MTHFTLHEQAKTSFKDVDFSLITTELLNETDEFATVWHRAAKHGTLKDIPKRFFTSEALSQKTPNGMTVWHYAAYLNIYLQKKL